MDGRRDCADGSDENPEPCCLECRLDRASSVDAKCLTTKAANDEEITEQNAKAIIASTVLAFLSFGGALYLWNYVEQVKKQEKKKAANEKLDAHQKQQEKLKEEEKTRKERDKAKIKLEQCEKHLKECTKRHTAEEGKYNANCDNKLHADRRRLLQTAESKLKNWQTQQTEQADQVADTKKGLAKWQARMEELKRKRNQLKDADADIQRLQDEARTNEYNRTAQSKLEDQQRAVETLRAAVKGKEDEAMAVLQQLEELEQKMKGVAAHFKKAQGQQDDAEQAKAELSGGFARRVEAMEREVENQRRAFNTQDDRLARTLNDIEAEIERAAGDKPIEKQWKGKKKEIEARRLKLKEDLEAAERGLEANQKKRKQLEKDQAATSGLQKIIEKLKELDARNDHFNEIKLQKTLEFNDAQTKLRAAEAELASLKMAAQLAVAAAGRAGICSQLFGAPSAAKQIKLQRKIQLKLGDDIAKLGSAMVKYTRGLTTSYKTYKIEEYLQIYSDDLQKRESRLEKVTEKAAEAKAEVARLTKELEIDPGPRDRAKEALDKAEREYADASAKYAAAYQEVSEAGKQAGQQNIRLRVKDLKHELMACPVLRTPAIAASVLKCGRIKCPNVGKPEHNGRVKQCDQQCDRMDSIPTPEALQHGDFIVWRKERRAASFFISVVNRRGGNRSDPTMLDGSKYNAIELKINHDEGCLVYADKYCHRDDVVPPVETHTHKTVKSTEAPAAKVTGYVAETLHEALTTKIEREEVFEGFSDQSELEKLEQSNEHADELEKLHFFRRVNEYDDESREKIYLKREIVVGKKEFLEHSQDVYPNTFKYILLFVFEFYDWMSDWQFYAINVNNDDRFHCSVQQDFGTGFKLADYSRAVLFFNVIGTLAVFPVELAVLLARLWLSQDRAEQWASWVSSGMLISILLEDLPQLILQAVYFGATGTARFNLISGFSIFCTVGGLTISLFMSRTFIQNVWYEFIVNDHKEVKESEDGDFKREVWQLASILLMLVHFFDFVSSWTFFARVLSDANEELVVQADMEASGGDYARFHQAYIAVCVLHTLICPLRVWHCAKHYNRKKDLLDEGGTGDGNLQLALGGKSADLLFGPLLCVTTLFVDVPEFGLQMAYLSSIGASDSSTGYASSAVFTLMFSILNITIAVVLAKRFVSVFIGPVLGIRLGPRSSAWNLEKYREAGWQMVLGIFGVILLFDLASNWAFYEVVRDDDAFGLAWSQDVGYSVSRIHVFVLLLCLAYTAAALLTCGRIMFLLVSMVPPEQGTIYEKITFICSKKARQRQKKLKKEIHRKKTEDAENLAQDDERNYSNAGLEAEFVPYKPGRKMERVLGRGLVACLLISIPLVYLQNTYVQMQYNNKVDLKARPYAECWLEDYDTFAQCASNKTVAGQEPGTALSLGPDGVAVLAFLLTACQMIIGIYALWGLLAEKLGRAQTSPGYTKDKYRFLHLAAWPVTFWVLMMEVVSTAATYFFLTNSVTADSGKYLFESAETDSNGTSSIVVDYDTYRDAAIAFFWIGLAFVLPLLVFTTWRLMGHEKFAAWRGNPKKLKELKRTREKLEVEYEQVSAADHAAKERALAAVAEADERIRLKHLETKGFEIGHALALQVPTLDDELEAFESASTSRRNIPRRKSSAFEGESTKQDDKTNFFEHQPGEMPAYVTGAFAAALAFKHVPLVVLASMFLQKKMDGTAVFALIAGLVAAGPSLGAMAMWIAGYHPLLLALTSTSLLSWVSNWMYYLLVLIPGDGIAAMVRGPFLALVILQTLQGPIVFWFQKDYMGRRTAHKWRVMRSTIVSNISKCHSKQQASETDEAVDARNMKLDAALDQEDGTGADALLNTNAPEATREDSGAFQIESLRELQEDQGSSDLLWDAAGSTNIVYAYAAEFLSQTLPCLMIQIVAIRGGATSAATSCAILFGVSHVCSTCLVLGRWAAQQGAAFLFLALMHFVNAILLWFMTAAVYEIGADDTTPVAVSMVVFCVWASVAVPAIQLRSCLSTLRSREALDEDETCKRDTDTRFQYDLFDGLRKLSEGPRPDEVRKGIPRPVQVHICSIVLCSLPVLILEAIAVHSVLDGRYRGIAAAAIMSALFTLGADCRVVGLWLHKQHPSLVAVVSIQALGLVFVWLFGGVCAVSTASAVLVTAAYAFIALATLVIFPAQFAAERRQLSAVSTQSDRLQKKQALIHFSSLKEAQSKTDAGNDIYIALDNEDDNNENDIYSEILNHQQKREKKQQAIGWWVRLKIKVAYAGEALTQDTLTGLGGTSTRAGGAGVVKSCVAGFVLKSLPLVVVLGIYLQLYGATAGAASASIAVLALIWIVAGALLEIFIVASWAYRHHFTVLVYFATEAANVVTMWLPVINLALGSDDSGGYSTAAAVTSGSGGGSGSSASGSAGLTAVVGLTNTNAGGFASTAAPAYVVFCAVGTVMLPYQLWTCWQHFDLEFSKGAFLSHPRKGRFKAMMRDWFLLKDDEGADPRVVRFLGWLPLLLRHVPAIAILVVLEASVAARSIALVFATPSALVALLILLNRGYESCFYPDEDVSAAKRSRQHRVPRDAVPQKHHGRKARQQRRPRAQDKSDLTGLRRRNQPSNVARARARSMAQHAGLQPGKYAEERQKRAHQQHERRAAAAANDSDDDGVYAPVGHTPHGDFNEESFSGFYGGAAGLLEEGFLGNNLLKEGYDRRMNKGAEVNADTGDMDIYDGSEGNGRVVEMYGAPDGPAAGAGAAAGAAQPLAAVNSHDDDDDMYAPVGNAPQGNLNDGHVGAHAGFDQAGDRFEPRAEALGEAAEPPYDGFDGAGDQFGPRTEPGHAAGFDTYEEPVDVANHEAHNWWFAGGKVACNDRLLTHGRCQVSQGSLHGDFLVRKGSQSPFVLCVRREKDVKPFQVRAANGTQALPAAPYSLEGSSHQHSSLPDLVEHYKSHRIHRNRETGLALKLRKVCPSALLQPGGGVKNRNDRPPSRYDGFRAEEGDKSQGARPDSLGADMHGGQNGIRRNDRPASRYDGFGTGAGAGGWNDLYQSVIDDADA